MQVVKAGALYFALVFGAGFVLGTVRTLWVVPRLGTRTAELMEMPIMLAVTILAARWTVLHLKVPSMWSARLEMDIQHDGPKGHPLETHTKGWEIHPSIKPLESESVVRKRESDSFFETTLQEELKKRGIKHLVIAGGMTEYCVDTTCRRATSLGYDVTLARDAHLTRDNGVLTVSV